MGKKKLGPFVIYSSSLISSDSIKDLNSRQKKIGIVVPKKNVKLSVNRNLIRRWVKEMLRVSNLETNLILKVNRPILAKSKHEKFLLFNDLKKLISLVTSDN